MTPTTPPKPPPRKAAGAPPPPPTHPKRATKTFSVKPWTGAGEGEKIVGYGTSGVGKTTLFAMLPRPVFLGLDDGGRKIRDPRSGKPIQHVEGVATFHDVRDALHQTDLWTPEGSCVIDTATILETLAEPWMFENIKHEKGGTVSSIEGYGYGKGYVHLLEAIRLILQDLDSLVRRGVHVGLICQSMAVRRANPGGMDFLEDGPKLYHPASEKNSIRLHVCEWADHVFRIASIGTTVTGAKDAKVGKVSGTDVSRAVYTMPEPHFFAKTRTLVDPVISFDAPTDDSVWRLLFPQEYNE